MKIQVQFRALGGAWYMGLGGKGIENTSKVWRIEMFLEEQSKGRGLYLSF